MKTFIDIFKTVMMAAVFLVSAVGCSDDIDYPAGSGPEGEDTKLTLKINVTEATKLSRATSDSYVKSLWVGIYNSSTGERTNTQYFFSRNEDVPGHAFKTLENIDCKSGYSYIVAVANYEDQTATDMRDKTTGPLDEKLEKATTWEAYCALAIEQNMASGVDISIAEPSGELIMSGAYYKSNHDVGKAPGEMEPVYISSKTANLTGAIHLRRLWSKNTLNISADGDIVSMELLDLEIINVPKYSWVQDRAVTVGLDGNLTTVNAGDVIDSKALENSAYLTSPRVTPPAEITVKENVYTFSFWQFENKRTGTATNYDEREKEYKDAAGKNTGIYTSLCQTADGNSNNNATYIKIHANITYNDPKGNLQNPSITYPENVEPLPGSTTSRTADVTYIVHLGFIGRDAKDYNCYRNTEYTYNISARTVNQILVEAFTNTENQPGAVGNVTDVTDKLYSLDAHYGVFNIYLEKEEISNFSFSMVTYNDNKEYRVYRDKNGNSNIEDVPKEYYDWVELVATGNKTNNKTYEQRLAPYPGHGSNKILYLGDLPDSELEGQWFTVYVNEYAYESRLGDANYGDEKKEKRWKKYVNQPNRQAWFNVDQAISNDGLSAYYKSKYALTQKSIQTYYNYEEESCENALGVEHLNESFGLNIRWANNVTVESDVKQIVPTDTDVLDADRGRYNVWYSLGLTSSNRSWKDFLALDTQQTINTVNNSLADNLDVPEFYAVPKQLAITSGLTGTAGRYNGAASTTIDPQSGSNAQFVNAIFACMNRNRDENGNGVIEASELKWYLPGSGKLLRVILGRNSLSTPIMDYKETTIVSNYNAEVNTLYHYITSDTKIIWGEEGLSSGLFLSGGAWQNAPWQLRCVRDLGTVIETTPSNTEVEELDPAYIPEIASNGGGVVHVKHYYSTALRNPTTEPILMHKISSPENKVGMYGFEIAPANLSFDGDNDIEYGKRPFSNVDDQGYKDYAYYIANPTECIELETKTGRKGWRVPNQKEIAIIFKAKALRDRQSNRSYAYPLTCSQLHWDKNGNSSPALGIDYRVVTMSPMEDKGEATWDKLNALRCVRDLTAAEADKSYDDIVNNR